MDWINLLQWPAMIVTVAAAWFVASQRKLKRNWGFWLFLLSNVLWIAWGVYDRAYALMVLQLCLALMNIRAHSIVNRLERQAVFWLVLYKKCWFKSRILIISQVGKGGSTPALSLSSTKVPTR
jgi:hypothetical protein